MYGYREVYGYGHAVVHHSIIGLLDIVVSFCSEDGLLIILMINNDKDGLLIISLW